jgi:hypothetical protein
MWQHIMYLCVRFSNAGIIINLSDVRFTKDQIQTLSLGPNYAIEKEPKQYNKELTVDTENAIRQLDPKLQIVYRHLTAKESTYLPALETTHTQIHIFHSSGNLTDCLPSMFCTNLTLYTPASHPHYNALPFEKLFVVWQRFQIVTLLTFLSKRVSLGLSSTLSPLGNHLTEFLCK